MKGINLSEIFYHGTSASRIDRNIKENGLVPREGRASNWFTQGVESNSHVVYLTSNAQEAEFYEFRAALANNDMKTARIIIKAENLDSDNFRPDENYIDMQERGQFTNCPLDIRDKQQEKVLNDRRWRESLEACEKITHLGKIDPSHFSEIIYSDVTENTYYDEELFKMDLEKRLKSHDAWLSGMGHFSQNKNYYKGAGYPAIRYYLEEFNDYFVKGFLYMQNWHRNLTLKSPEPH